MPGVKPAQIVDILDAQPIHHFVRGMVLDVQRHLFDQFVDHLRQACQHPFQLLVEIASLAGVQVGGSGGTDSCAFL